METIGEICRRRGILFHTDAAQSIGKFPIDVVKMKLDLVSLTGHKIFGPKGIGALFIDWERVEMDPLIMGGG